MGPNVDNEKMHVERAIRDTLRSDEKSIQLDEAVDTIVTYVFHKKPKINDNNRYEWFYAILGMGVSIAQAWQQNYLPELDDSSGTIKSIKQYIEKTYGENFSDYP